MTPASSGQPTQQGQVSGRDRRRTLWQKSVESADAGLLDQDNTGYARKHAGNQVKTRVQLPPAPPIYGRRLKSSAAKAKPSKGHNDEVSRPPILRL